MCMHTQSCYSYVKKLTSLADLRYHKYIQCAAIKKTPLQKLQNGVIFLYEIFSDYYGENLL